MYFDTTLINEIYTILGVTRTDELDIIIVFIAGLFAYLILDSGLRMFLEVILGPFKR